MAFSFKKFLDSSGISRLWNNISDNYFNKGEIQMIVETIDETKADIASPTFTGVPQAPTAMPGTATDQIATTAFVQAAMKGTILITITPAHAGIVATATLEDGSWSINASSSSAGIITLPVNYFGKYRITYSDPRVKSDRYIEVQSATVQNVDARFSELVTFTIRIDETNSNPNTSCVYMDDAANMTKGSFDWDEMPIFNDIRPCLLKNGQLQYYLNPEDFTKKYGSNENSVLTGADGDVMIEFRRFAYRIYRDGNYLYVSVTNDFTNHPAYDGYISGDAPTATDNWCYDAFSREEYDDIDKFYHGAFKGYIDNNGKLRSIAGVQPTANKNIGEFRSAAQANGDHYQQSVYAQLKAIQCLYLIKYGNRNGQEALGRGIVGVTDDSSSNLSYACGYNAAADDGVISGTMNSTTATFAQGMDYGTTANSTSHMKLFGIEDFWGNIWEWVDGLTTDADWNIITSYNNYSGEDVTNITTNTIASGLSANNSGWNKKVSGTSTSGFMPIEWGGSSSTYWADNGLLYASRVLTFGGDWNSGDNAGPFSLDADATASHRNRHLSARLTYV